MPDRGCTLPEQPCLTMGSLTLRAILRLSGPQRMFSDLSPSFGAQADSAMPLPNGSSKSESRSTYLLCLTMPSCQKASILSAEAKDKQVLGSVIFAATGSKMPGTGTEQNRTGSTKSMRNTVLIGHLWPGSICIFIENKLKMLSYIWGLNAVRKFSGSRQAGLQRKKFK